MKTEIMQKIIDKQGEIDNVRVNQLLNLNEQLSPNNFTLPIYQLEMKYNSLCSKITLLRSELASLKSQLAEAGEEKKLTDEQIQQYVTDRFSDSHLLPEIIAFRAIKYYRLGLPPMNGNKAVLD